MGREQKAAGLVRNIAELAKDNHFVVVDPSIFLEEELSSLMEKGGDIEELGHSCRDRQQVIVWQGSARVDKVQVRGGKLWPQKRCIGISTWWKR